MNSNSNFNVRGVIFAAIVLCFAGGMLCAYPHWFVLWGPLVLATVYGMVLGVMDRDEPVLFPSSVAYVAVFLLVAGLLRWLNIGHFWATVLAFVGAMAAVIVVIGKRRVGRDFDYEKPVCACDSCLAGEPLKIYEAFAISPQGGLPQTAGNVYRLNCKKKFIKLYKGHGHTVTAVALRRSNKFAFKHLKKKGRIPAGVPYSSKELDDTPVVPEDAD